MKKPLLFIIPGLVLISLDLISTNNNNADVNQNDGQTLSNARAAFQTKIVDTSFEGDG